MAEIKFSQRPDVLLASIREKVNVLSNEDGSLTSILNEIGEDIALESQRLARAKGIVATGNLVRSIRAEVMVTSGAVDVEVGPVGVGYAIFQELGARRTDFSRRAMFANLREKGMLDRAAKPGFTKDIHLARPFMTPAFNLHKDRVVNAIQEAFRSG